MGLPGLAQLPGKISSIICSLTSRSYSALSLAYYMIKGRTIYTGHTLTYSLTCLLTYSRACSSGLEIVFCSLTGEP